MILKNEYNIVILHCNITITLKLLEQYKMKLFGKLCNSSPQKKMNKQFILQFAGSLNLLLTFVASKSQVREMVNNAISEKLKGL